MDGQPNYGIIHSGSGELTVNNSGIGKHVTVNNTVPAAAGAGHDARPGRAAGADAGIITIVAEETAAVVSLMRSGWDFREEVQPDGARFYAASLPGPARPIRTVLLQAVQQGQRPAALAFERLRAYCSPGVVALVGIAGGIHPEVRLGDVVIGDEVIYYDSRKVTDAAVLRRGQGHAVPVVVRRAVNAFFTDAGADLVTLGGIRIWHGPIGSGEAVVAASASDIRRYLTAMTDKVLAVEMEGGGVAQAFYEAVAGDRELRGWVTVRGISDRADTEKDDRFRAIAAANAASVLRALLPQLTA